MVYAAQLTASHYDTSCSLFLTLKQTSITHILKETLFI